MAEPVKLCGAERVECACGHHQSVHTRIEPGFTRRGPCQACDCKAFAGKPCDKPGTGAGGRCRRHGGASLQGVVHGSFRGGLYRQSMTGRMKKLYDRIMADEQMLSLREEIGAMRTLAVDLAMRQRDLAWGAPAAGRAFERVEKLWAALQDVDANPSRRTSSSDRGYGLAEWRNFRDDWLEDHPNCGDREGGASGEHSQCVRREAVTPATDVDHIVRVTGPDDPLFYDPSAVQSLCHACHSVKTQNEARDYADDEAHAPSNRRRAALTIRLNEAMHQLREAVDAAEGERRMRAEFRETATALERLARSENTRVVELYSMISAERAFALRQSETQILLDALDALVPDREVKNAIRRRVAKEFAKLAGRPTDDTSLPPANDLPTDKAS